MSDSRSLGGANEERGSAVVVVKGVRYDRMLSLNLKRSLDTATCTGSIVLSWPGAEHFNVQGIVARDLVDGADGVIMLDDQLAATIIFDERTSKGTPKSYELTLTFRGSTSSLVDGSPKHQTGQFNNLNPADLVRKLMEGYSNVGLVDKANLNERILRFIINEGETVERAARRASREYGLSFYEDEAGMWNLYNQADQIGRYGHALIMGRNFTEWSVKRNLWPRFPEIELTGSSVENENSYGDGSKFFSNEMRQMLGFGASGPGPSSLGRMMKNIVDGDMNRQRLDTRTQMEGNQRSGQGLNVTLRMSTWSDLSGRLWTVGTKHHIVIRVDDLDQQMTLKEVEYELSRDTRRATLTFVDDGTYNGTPGNFMDVLAEARRQEAQQEDNQQADFTVVAPIERPREGQQVPATQPEGEEPENT